VLSRRWRALKSLKNELVGFFSYLHVEEQVGKLALKCFGSFRSELDAKFAYGLFGHFWSPYTIAGPLGHLGGVAREPASRTPRYNTPNGKVTMNRPRSSPNRRVLVLPPDVDKFWDDLVWDDEGVEDTKAARKAMNAWKRRMLRRAERIGKRIAAEFEAERKKLLAETQKKLRQERLELLIDDFEESQRAAIAKDFIESRRQTAAYVVKLHGAMRAALKREHDEMLTAIESKRPDASVMARVRKIEQDMERSKLHDERMLLLKRGVVRGRRR